MFDTLIHICILHKRVHTYRPADSLSVRRVETADAGLFVVRVKAHVSAGLVLACLCEDCICMCVYVCMYVGLFLACLCEDSIFIYLCMYVCMCVCVHVCMYVCRCMYARLRYVCVCVTCVCMRFYSQGFSSTYVSVHVCMVLCMCATTKNALAAFMNLYICSHVYTRRHTSCMYV